MCYYSLLTLIQIRIHENPKWTDHLTPQKGGTFFSRGNKGVPYKGKSKRNGKCYAVANLSY